MFLPKITSLPLLSFMTLRRLFFLLRRLFILLRSQFILLRRLLSFKFSRDSMLSQCFRIVRRLPYDILQPLEVCQQMCDNLVSTYDNLK